MTHAARIAMIRLAHWRWLDARAEHDDTPARDRGGRLVLDNEPAAHVDLSALAIGDEPLADDEVRRVIQGRANAMETERL